MTWHDEGRVCRWPPGPYVAEWRPDLPCRAADLDFALPRALLTAREAGLQRIRPHLRSLGLTEAGWRILRVLESAGRPLTQTEIARHAGGTDTNARIAAKRLVQRKWAAWQDDPDPGHRTNDWRAGPWLALAQGGHDMIFRVRHRCRVGFLDPGARFPDAKRTALQRGLTHVIRAMGASVPVALDPPPLMSGDDDRPGWTAEAMHDLDLGLPLLMKHARAAVLGPVRRVLAEHGLSEPQWRILRLLARFEAPVPKKAVIRGGCFLGPEARHAMAALMARNLMRFDTTPKLTAKRRRPSKKKRRRFKIALTPDGKRMIAQVEDAEYAALAPAMTRVSAGAVLALGPLLSQIGQAWLWTPGMAEDAAPGPLDAAYAQQDDSARINSALWHARKRAAKWMRMGWGPEGPGPIVVPRPHSIWD